ncbi:NIPSNAP family protein [Ferruginibacter sp. SUN106]|uniref:NIPSNAP family protein n=1 Tax=Ferruginibacter sp. SUN106 TaxID=2978348 RepID=UPI003D36F521
MKSFSTKFLLLSAVFFLFASFVFAGKKPKREMYQLTVYQYATAAQETVLTGYLKDALLPALHKMGYKNIGVFKSLANDTSAIKTLYVYMPIKSLEDQVAMAEKLSNDANYQTAGASYINAVYTAPPYTRMEVILLKAFPLAPQMQLPNLTAPKNERVYELRSYEGATEKIFANKVQMFNQGNEIDIFKRINANAVFYSEVIAGSHMPNLMYMTCYNNKADRDAHWKAFSSDPAWKTLSALPEYQHNVSHIDIMFIQPLEFSDF